MVTEAEKTVLRAQAQLEYDAYMEPYFAKEKSAKRTLVVALVFTGLVLALDAVFLYALFR